MKDTEKKISFLSTKEEEKRNSFEEEEEISSNAIVESDDSDAKRDCRAASGDKIFVPERPPVTVSTLPTKDEKEISFFLSFSFASSKDLEKEILFSSMIFDFRRAG